MSSKDAKENLTYVHVLKVESFFLALDAQIICGFTVENLDFVESLKLFHEELIIFILLALIGFL